MRELERLEGELEALTEARDHLQQQVVSFDGGRSSYSDLSLWTEEAEALSAKIEQVEEKWLALAERA